MTGDHIPHYVTVDIGRPVYRKDGSNVGAVTCRTRFSHLAEWAGGRTGDTPLDAVRRQELSDALDELDAALAYIAVCPTWAGQGRT